MVDHDMLIAMQEIVTAAVQPINERLDRLEAGQSKLEAGQSKLEAGQSKLEAGQSKLEEELRHTRVLVEGNQSDIRGLAENQRAIIDKLDDMSAVKATVADNRSRIGTLETVAKSQSQRITALEASAV